MTKEKQESKNAIYLEEFHQAWEHYRHLENARTKYMNFFFTALFAVIGLYSAIIKIDQFKLEEFELLIGFLLILVFTVFTLYVFINIIRIGWVLTGYSNVMRQLRINMYGEKSIPEKISVRDYLPIESKHKVYSIQYSAETLLKFSLILMMILSITVVFFNWSILCWYSRIIIITSILFVLILEIIVIRKGLKKKQLVKKN
jgi:hypothetical protein